ncbi:metal-dependent hydrolase [Halapricum hydrolyticum]|uniref:Metal-dependent hydrolase n=1 Tax=Halapricum hydrolyticum TaxID=2979991 RepID=A0AAE3I9E1_9EURY|nr:metal-dependent hydrolase [Halapricum hydrolyticum]MCU4717319.1 metal-dependent hydrolase [Halapricum hydrolyticum]MCU4726246.1 metal-dependent hydrolase [Halapricum hydrolyticum]
MYRTGHQGVNLVLFAPVFAALALTGHVVLGIVGVAVVFTTASMPDADVRLPLVAHRGITHTVWAASALGLAVAIPVYYTGAAVASSVPELAVYTPATLGVYSGSVVAFSVLGHLVGDLVTPMGIRPFAPLSDRSYSLGLWTADSIANKVLFGIGVVVLSGTVALLALV